MHQHYLVMNVEANKKGTSHSAAKPKAIETRKKIMEEDSASIPTPSEIEKKID